MVHGQEAQKRPVFPGKRRVWQGWAMLLVLVLAFPGGCDKVPEKAVREKAVNVRTQPSEAKSFRPFLSAVGSLLPDEQVTVSSEVDGILREVRVEEGGRVHRGMVLAVVNETDYRLEIQRAEAALRQAEASLENTNQEHARKAALFADALITRQQMDDVSTRRTLASAEVDRAKASLSLAKERLGKTSIVSPLAGAVKEKKVSAGDYVRAATPLFTLIRTDPLKISFAVPEKEAARIRLGQEVRFQVASLGGREFAGRVKIIFPHVDEKTRTLQVEAQVPNREGVLKAGFFARATLYTGDPRLLVVVPLTSILYEGTRTRLFVVEGNTAKERSVLVGDKYGEMIEIREGVAAGEEVVVVGQNNLSEGAKVHVAR